MYPIDHELSTRFRTPVIKLEQNADISIKKLLTEDEQYWQKRTGSSVGQNLFRIRPIHCFELLQRLACHGKIIYKEKALICDFFSKVSLEFLADNAVVDASLSLKGQSWSASSCDLILQGPPHCIVKEGFLRFIDPKVSWQTLELARSCPKTFTANEYTRLKKDLLDEEIEFVEFESSPQIPQAQTLELVDSTFGFANLVTELNPQTQKELEEAGFIRKLMANSSYFCPLDKAQKAVLALINAGWKVFDEKMRLIVSLTPKSYSLISRDHDFVLRGNIDEVAFERYVEAFQKNEKLIPLSDNRVGLLTLDKTLSELLPHIELVCDTISIKKRSLGALQDVLDDIDCSESVKQEITGSNHTTKLCGFTGELRPYQALGVTWMQNLYNRNFSGLLADEMGLGKTVQVLAFLSSCKGPFLIIVPTTLLYNWKREIETFLPNHTVQIFHGLDRFLGNADITLTSFGIARTDYSTLSKTVFDCLIVDEAQNMKNRETLTFQALQKLKAHCKLSLTGTPIENSLSELTTHFHFLQPDLFQNIPESIALVKKLVRPFLLRRKKQDVAKDLPEKIEQTVFVTMAPEQKELYERFLHTARQGLIKKISIDGASKHRMEVFEIILRLRQICGHPLLVPQIADSVIASSKCDAVLDDIETLISEGKKVVVFSQFAKMLQLLSREAKNRNWSYLLLDGKTKNRAELVDRFQTDPDTPLFFISLKAGGVGLNLTAADHVLLYDPWWNRSQEDQAIDRAHRIGRKDTVFAKRYIMLDTIEEKILALQEKKLKIFETVMDEEEYVDTPQLDELVDLLLL